MNLSNWRNVKLLDMIENKDKYTPEEIRLMKRIIEIHGENF